MNTSTGSYLNHLSGLSMNEIELLKAFCEDIKPKDKFFCASVFRPEQNGSCDTVAVMYSIEGCIYIFAYGLHLRPASWVKHWEKSYVEYDTQGELEEYINTTFKHEHVFFMSNPLENYIKTMEEEFPYITINYPVKKMGISEWKHRFSVLEEV
jgi:hypothetical protein